MYVKYVTYVKRRYLNIYTTILMIELIYESSQTCRKC